MSTPAEVRLARRVLRHELEAIRGNWGWILALGIILIVVGTIAVATPLVATLASAFAFGVLQIRPARANHRDEGAALGDLFIQRFDEVDAWLNTVDVHE